jgi:nitroreductase
MLTSTFWRNAWKYQARAYRHSFWDSGAVLANLLALVAAEGIPASVLMGSADRDLNALLGVDGVTEAAVAMVAVGDDAVPPDAPGPLATLDAATEPLSTRQVHYPEIESAHLASSLIPERVAEWRAAAGAGSNTLPRRVTDATIDEVIERRRSTRRFGRRPIGRAALEAILEIATAPVPGDASIADAIAPFLIVNAVEGMASGVYGPGLEPIRLGDARRRAGALAMWQQLGADAAVDLYLLSDLDEVSERLGERGYRVAQLAGGIAGGRAELAATALGLGSTGLTFFDDEVTRFFEPAARGRQVMYDAAVGQRA